MGSAGGAIRALTDPTTATSYDSKFVQAHPPRVLASIDTPGTAVAPKTSTPFRSPRLTTPSLVTTMPTMTKPVSCIQSDWLTLPSPVPMTTTIPPKHVSSATRLKSGHRRKVSIWIWSTVVAMTNVATPPTVHPLTTLWTLHRTVPAHRSMMGQMRIRPTNVAYCGITPNSTSPNSSRMLVVTTIVLSVAVT